MSLPASPDNLSVTQLLDRIEAGDEQAKKQLFDQVYSELRRMAADMMRHESPQHTLQPTALVNEAALRLLNSENLVDVKSRAYFFGAMARAMRQVLVAHARSRKRLKRGGDFQRIPLDEVIAYVRQQHGLDLIALDEALNELERHSPRHNDVVTLRFFGGYSIANIAEQLGVSASTVVKDLRFARAWLGKRLAL